MMKKSTFGAMLAFLFVAAGALTAMALYLKRREKELDEYESLLFSDDMDLEDDEETEYQKIDDEPDAPADNGEDEGEATIKF